MAVLDFSAVSIKKASLQFIGAGGVAGTGEPFGCMGSLEAETEVKEKVKNCEGAIQTVSIPLYMTVNVAGHMKAEAIKQIFGISNTGLKTGVNAYGINSKGKRFVFTAEVIDEFEDVVKLIAFPRGSGATGLTIKVDNDQDETPYIELEFKANADDLGNFYYEVFESEADEGIKTAWHTAFNTTLVKLPTP